MPKLMLHQLENAEFQFENTLKYFKNFSATVPEQVSGYHEKVACLRSLQEAMSGLFWS